MEKRAPQEAQLLQSLAKPCCPFWQNALLKIKAGKLRRLAGAEKAGHPDKKKLYV